jgi:hypothetical protein
MRFDGCRISEVGEGLTPRVNQTSYAISLVGGARSHKRWRAVARCRHLRQGGVFRGYLAHAPHQKAAVTLASVSMPFSILGVHGDVR